MNGSVVVTSRSFSGGRIDLERQLQEAGLAVVRADVTHRLTMLAPVLADAVAWIAGTAPVTAEHLALAPALRVIARYGVGVDAVDLVAAAARGIAVTNTPGANSESVADYALSLLLMSLRRIGAGDRAVRTGHWAAIRGREIAALTVGVAGFGRIGQAFAARMGALGAKVVVFDPYLPEGVVLPAGVARVQKVRELAGLDAVSLHAPGGSTLIDEAWLADAQGLALVNTARADLVDEPALAAALAAGNVATYAADMLSGEERGSIANPLLDPALADRVTVTPHLASLTEQAIDRMGAGAVGNVLAVLGGRDPLDPVFPPHSRVSS